MIEFELKVDQFSLIVDKVKRALNLSFGFGGANAALILEKAS
ncbi:hypothetical protein [Providencia huaxiensis]